MRVRICLNTWFICHLLFCLTSIIFRCNKHGLNEPNISSTAIQQKNPSRPHSTLIQHWNYSKSTVTSPLQHESTHHRATPSTVLGPSRRLTPQCHVPLLHSQHVPICLGGQLARRMFAAQSRGTNRLPLSWSASNRWVRRPLNSVDRPGPGLKGWGSYKEQTLSILNALVGL